MDFSDNMEQWNINSWITETLTRNTGILTGGSLSEHSDTVAVTKSQTTSSVQSPSLSGSDPDTSITRRCNGIANGKITKRKSRASKRNATTFITADPSNFRRMVQQVTGFRVGNGQVPVVPLLKPEPHRLFNRFQGCLPTLDTSAFLLDQQQQMVGPTSTAPMIGYAPEANGFSFESISNFPTLESWKVL